MVKWTNCIKVRLFFILVIFFSLVIFFFKFGLLVTKGSSIYIDNSLSCDAHDKICKLISNQNMQKINANNLYRCIIKNCNYVDKVNINYLSNHNAIIKVISQKPLLLINDEYILTDKAKVVDKHIFKDKFSELNNVYINNLDNLDFKYLEFLSDIFYKNYKIEWIDKNNIQLSNYLTDKLTIITSTQKLDRGLINKAEELYKQEVSTKGKGEKVKIDLRFEGRIILLT